MAPADQAEKPRRLEPQYQISGVLGNYWFHRSEQLPSGFLVDIAADFGITEASARQAMRRLVNRGTLVSSRNGRNTSYGFPSGKWSSVEGRVSELLRQGSRPPQWDGTWVMLTFSIPEARRDTRRSMRTRLKSLGFAGLYDAVWVTPHDRHNEVVELLAEYEITDAQLFRATPLQFSESEKSLSSIFDLSEVAEGYQAFIDKYSTLDLDLDSADSMTTHMQVHFDWGNAFRNDPDLPQELLPSDWPRPEAYEVFRRSYNGLADAGERRFRELLTRHDEQLAPLTGHHTVPEPSDD